MGQRHKCLLNTLGQIQCTQKREDSAGTIIMIMTSHHNTYCNEDRL